MDIFFRMGSDQNWESPTHDMNRFACPRLSYLLKLLPIDLPKLDHSIEASRHQEKQVIHTERINVFYRAFMLTYSHWSHSLLLRVPSFNSSIRMSKKEHHVLLHAWLHLRHPAHTHDRTLGHRRLLSYWLHLWRKLFGILLTSHPVSLILLSLLNLDLIQHETSIPTTQGH